MFQKVCNLVLYYFSRHFCDIFVLKHRGIVFSESKHKLLFFCGKTQELDMSSQNSKNKTFKDKRLCTEEKYRANILLTENTEESSTELKKTLNNNLQCH